MKNAIFQGYIYYVYVKEKPGFIHEAMLFSKVKGFLQKIQGFKGQHMQCTIFEKFKFTTRSPLRQTNKACELLNTIILRKFNNNFYFYDIQFVGAGTVKQTALHGIIAAQ